MEEKYYLFNPFNIKNAKETELRDMYNKVFDKIIEEPNTMYEYSHNIEVYANLNYIIGEIIARLTRDTIELKTKIQIDTAVNTTNARKSWNVDRDGKAPAMAYFEAVGTRISQDDINKLADKECSLKRFKNSYNATEEKMNALKKRMESIKYEEFNK